LLDVDTKGLNKLNEEKEEGIPAAAAAAAAAEENINWANCCPAVSKFKDVPFKRGGESNC